MPAFGGLGLEGLVFGVSGAGCRVHALGFEVQGARMHALGFVVEGLGSIVLPARSMGPSRGACALHVLAMFSQ